jgi:hypothetical protein
MPVKLPAPLAGTAEHAGPKFMLAVAAGALVADGAAGAASSPLPLLQPAASRARPARVPTSTRRE